MRKPSENGRGGRKSPSDRKVRPAGKGKPSSSGFRKSSESEGSGERKSRLGSDKKSGPAREKRFSSDRPSRRNPKTDRFEKGEDKERRSSGGFERKGKSEPARERRYSSDRPSDRNSKSDRFEKGEDKERRSSGGFERREKSGPKKTFGGSRFSEKQEGGKTFRGPSKSSEERESYTPKSFGSKAPRGPRKSDEDGEHFEKKTFSGKALKGPRKTERTQEGEFKRSRPSRRDKPVRAPQVSKHQDGTIRLNRFLSNAGLASRREADVMIEAGLVKINGKIVTELGTRVNPELDEIQYGGERIKSEKKVYLLVNKPKNIITTTDDPEGRNTVMELIRDFPGKERVFPVGRLDRNTTGVLLLTNDGELSNKLTHPRYGVKKVYIVTLDKPLKPADRHRLLEGVELEDGMVQADAIEMKDENDKSVVFFEIHSGKNRIVRRMFESIGYEVIKLDRTLFGGLSKAGLRRGQWRILDETEISRLKKL